MDSSIVSKKDHPLWGLQISFKDCVEATLGQRSGQLKQVVGGDGLTSDPSSFHMHLSSVGWQHPTELKSHLFLCVP